MKKSLILLALLIPLSGCASEARQEYERVLAAKLAKDPDLKDYNLDPNEVAACVTDRVAAELPGFPGSPAREPYWRAHILFQEAKNPLEARQAIEKAAEVFGSKREASRAAFGVTSHIMVCIGELIHQP